MTGRRAYLNETFVSNPENLRNCEGLGKRELGLKVTGLFIAVEADSDRMVPATRGDSPAVMRALVAEALSAGAAVVLGELDAELLAAAVAVQDLMIGHPVGRPGRVLHQACRRKKGDGQDTTDSVSQVPTGKKHLQILACHLLHTESTIVLLKNADAWPLP